MDSIVVRSEERYADSLKKLLPQGEYWDKQLANPNSDVVLTLKARAKNLVVIKEQMSSLQKESQIETADKTIDEWELTLLGYTNPTLPLEQRIQILLTAETGAVNIGVLNIIAEPYGVRIVDLTFPFPPAFYAHSVYGVKRIGSPAGFSVVDVLVDVLPAQKEEFERVITGALLANNIVYFTYGGE